MTLFSLVEDFLTGLKLNPFCLLITTKNDKTKSFLLLLKTRFMIFKETPSVIVLAPILTTLRSTSPSRGHKKSTLMSGMVNVWNRVKMVKEVQTTFQTVLVDLPLTHKQKSLLLPFPTPELRAQPSTDMTRPLKMTFHNRGFSSKS